MASYESCIQCNRISDAMHRWRFESNNALVIELGTFEDLISRDKCGTCRAIAQYFCAENDLDDENDLSPACRLRFKRASSSQRFKILLTSGDEEEDDYFVEVLELIPPFNLEPNTGYYLKLDPHWLDIARIARWPAHCDMDHQGICHSFPTWRTIDLPPQLILIDVHSWNLTVMEPKIYVALSYVWGRIPDILESTMENFESLQRPGSLSSPQTLGRLPKSVHDAIVLTKSIGQRYLWVDRLCIVQNDFENKKTELAKMAAIYARSHFTIVAVDGVDADHGLRGVPGTTSPRNLEQYMYQFSAQCTMMQAPVPEQKVDIKEWHRRGWTFQERTLSHRNLVFFQDQVFWECRKATWIEDLADVSEGANPLTVSKRQAVDPHDLEYLRWPDLRQYANLAYRYNRRLLGFQSDALNAFAAVIQVLSRSFPGGFLHGLPEYYFDYAMLWVPIFEMEKRKFDGPSWSWLSLAGDMTFMYYSACDFLQVRKASLWLKPRLQLRPMVKWHKIHIRTGQKHLIDNSYYVHQMLRDDANSALPPGWSRQVRKQSHPDIRRDENDFVWFKHDEILPWGTPFLYPVPVAPEPLPVAQDCWSTQLSFTAMRQHLLIGSVMRGRYESGGSGRSSYWDAEVPGCLVFSLLDSAGRWIGLIRSSFRDEKDVPTGEHCEIIVLSAGEAYKDRWDAATNNIMELTLRDELKTAETYEFYNVMWIERKTNVAYRRAVGRVWKSAWERGSSDVADILLG
ncbi:heterokaryon incompatibility protein-domain-containing protein [Paraphoma chrysanthemicola]|nr:heterokaryon incompatibility protein-domain-containing protein [Paraphoma chrysanthemicola]